jgi:hypothetical protein
VSTSGAEATQAIIAGENDAGFARTNSRRELTSTAACTSGGIYCGGGGGCGGAAPAAGDPTRKGR